MLGKLQDGDEPIVEYVEEDEAVASTSTLLATSDASPAPSSIKTSSKRSWSEEDEENETIEYVTSVAPKKSKS